MPSHEHLITQVGPSKQWQTYTHSDEAIQAFKGRRLSSGLVVDRCLLGRGVRGDEWRC